MLKHKPHIPTFSLSQIFTMVLLCAWCLPGLARAKLADYPTPDWLTFSEVAQHMSINGLPSEVYYFSGDKSTQETLNFYRKKWSNHPDYSPGYRETTIPGWHIIARAEKNILLTVQVQSDQPNLSKGYFAIGYLDEIATPQLDSIPMLPGSNILSQSESNDFGKIGQVALVSNNASISTNSDFYIQYYTQRGWTNDTNHIDDKATTLIFRNSSKETNLVIKEIFGATQIVINTVTR